MEKIFAVDLSDSAIYSPASAYKTFGDLVNMIVKNSFMVAGLLSFALLVIGGFSVIMSAGGGDSKKLEQGKQTLTMALVGFLIVICSFWIVQVLQKITGVSLLQLSN
jgi:hypothetical protein